MGPNYRQAEKTSLSFGLVLTLAEREGFEPPIPLRVCRISSAVLSTTQPPLQPFDLAYHLNSAQAVYLAIATEIAIETP